MEKITDDIEKIYISNGNNENLQVNNICETDEKSQDFLNNETNENINVYQTSINSSTKYRRQFRDPTWLKVEVCREFLRNECTRNQEECKFAHPGFYCVIDNGKVITCYDSLKSRCMRERCKYFHPPKHIKTQIQYLGKSYQQSGYSSRSNNIHEISRYQTIDPYQYWVPWNMYMPNDVYPFNDFAPNYGYYDADGYSLSHSNNGTDNSTNQSTAEFVYIDKNLKHTFT
ncbi:hypothetical protein HZS_4894 [Henneguya salminicola]|nr:hypothetical protein HZS_4894 [Henneguya salminicola]